MINTSYNVMSHKESMDVSPLISTALDYLNENYANHDQALNLLADRLNVSPNYLCLKFKEETGIMIGTLVSYPLCLLGDLEKYRDFVGRGCPAQSGHLLNIGATGETHACVHEEKNYGNVFHDGISACYDNMGEWHSGEYIYDGCKECDYLD